MQWISVLDRLPEPGVDVLVFASKSGAYEFEFATLSNYEDEGRRWWLIGCENVPVDDNVVTHWCPLVGPNEETPE